MEAERCSSAFQALSATKVFAGSSEGGLLQPALGRDRRDCFAILSTIKVKGAIVFDNSVQFDEKPYNDSKKYQYINIQRCAA